MAIGRDDDLREVFYFTHTVKMRGVPPTETVKAWSWDEDLAKAYNQFHKSPNLKFRKYTGTIGEIGELFEEFGRCEIKIARLKTRDPNNDERFIWVYVPGTEEEFDVMYSHVGSACMDMVHKYEQLQDMFYKLKDKYREALRLLLFEEFMKKANSQRSVIAEKISFDEVRLLVYQNPEDFGE